MFNSSMLITLYKIGNVGDRNFGLTNVRLKLKLNEKSVGRVKLQFWDLSGFSKRKTEKLG